MLCQYNQKLPQTFREKQYCLLAMFYLGCDVRKLKSHISCGRSAIGSRATSCAFLGYEINSTTYRCLQIENNIILESSDEIFHDEKFPLNWKIVGVKKLEKLFYHSLLLLLIL